MSPQERVPMIDALRGLSCLAILLYHAFELILIDGGE